MTRAPLVYGAYTQTELDAEYDTAVPVGGDSAPYLARFTAASEVARAALAPRTVSYGSGERELVDLYPARRPGAPLLIFFHGGYWRRLSKDEVAFVAPPVVDAGGAVAIPSYPLAPAANLDDIVAAVRRAFTAVVARADDLHADPARVVVAGHSVGAQLALAASADARVVGRLGLSGLYDLEPVRRSTANATVAMTAAQARRHAPLAAPPRHLSPLVLATGAREQSEFQRQQAAFARAWDGWGGSVTELPMPGHDHFSIVLELADARTKLSRTLRELLGLATPSSSRS